MIGGLCGKFFIIKFRNYMTCRSRSRSKASLSQTSAGREVQPERMSEECCGDTDHLLEAMTKKQKQSPSFSSTFFFARKNSKSVGIIFLRLTTDLYFSEEGGPSAYT